MDPRDSSGTDEEEEVQKLESGIPETASEEKKKKKNKLNDDDDDDEKESDRERVKRYRREVAGRSWMLPEEEERWGKEEWFLDRSSFDAALIGAVGSSRRELLWSKKSNSSSNRIRIHDSC
ncbi:hypothetical protein M569_04098 [Genlisea aurea]|uniref:Uncharacterized protein n=1 Tax=Genlisea aurea TaxID=192259 RepID=S8CZY7_9LAMI|nr:hypothetical protein M569_04098 [Genlisea aurea]